MDSDELDDLERRAEELQGKISAMSNEMRGLLKSLELAVEFAKRTASLMEMTRGFADEVSSHKK